MTDNKHIGEEIDEILKDVPFEPERVLPTLPVVFTGRDGETRQIGTAELQEDATIIITTYKGTEGALPALFSMPLAFNVDGNVQFKPTHD